MGKEIDEITKLHHLLMPALSKAAIGNFDSEIEIDHNNSQPMNELLMGVEVLLDVIREQNEELERLRAAKAPLVQPRTMLIDEVLRQNRD